MLRLGRLSQSWPPYNASFRDVVADRLKASASDTHVWVAVHPAGEIDSKSWYARTIDKGTVRFKWNDGHDMGTLMGGLMVGQCCCIF